MQRVLEPEVMDTWEEAVEYDAIDFTEVNTTFAQHAIALSPPTSQVLDAGTGTARIPILICQQCPDWQIIGIDLARSMLQIGLYNIEKAGLQQKIKLELVDAKQMPYQDGQFDMVISNSLVHHLPEPLPFFRELKRVTNPHGAFFIRDLIRPASEEIVNALVDSIGKQYDDSQKLLFRHSLHAALTLDEVKEMVEKAGLEGIHIHQSSDIHWTGERAYLG